MVLASGGFEANPEWRTRYLGPGWELAHVRGTRHNTGDGIRIALEAGAQPYGNWSGCHAVAWDAGSPPFGDRRVGDMFQKHSYPLGIIVNVRGERFVDEGADFRNYTYAKYGREILRQPQRLAFQIFDQKVVPILREEYRIREVTKGEAGTIEELARALDIDPRGLVRTVADFNSGGRPGRVQSRGARRQGHTGRRAAQVELGADARHAALRRVRGHLRDHLHVRRPPGHAAGRGPRHRGPADPRTARRG